MGGVACASNIVTCETEAGELTFKLAGYIHETCLNFKKGKKKGENENKNRRKRERERIKYNFIIIRH